MQEQLQAYQLSTESLVRQVEAAAAAGGRHLAEDVLKAVSKYKESQEASKQNPSVAALLQSAAEQQQAAAQQQGKQPGPKFMV